MQTPDRATPDRTQAEPKASATRPAAQASPSGNARPGAIGSSASDQPSAHPESRGTMVPG